MSIRKSLTNIFSAMGIYMFITYLWQQYEIKHYGHISVNQYDTIIAIILTVVIGLLLTFDFTVVKKKPKPINTQEYIKLPCKVGDKVYHLYRELDFETEKYSDYQVESIDVETVEYIPFINNHYMPTDTYFTNEFEALKKAKELNNNEKKN